MVGCTADGLYQGGPHLKRRRVTGNGTSRSTRARSTVVIAHVTFVKAQTRGAFDQRHPACLRTVARQE